MRDEEEDRLVSGNELLGVLPGIDGGVRQVVVQVSDGFGTATMPLAAATLPSPWLL